MNHLDQLSLGWQIFGGGLIGAVIFMALLLVVGTWPQLVDEARALFTDPLVEDDAFICPRNPVEERRTLSALTESSPLRLVVKR